MNQLSTTATVEATVDDGFEIEMVAPMPGFPAARCFVVLPLSERYAPFGIMRSLDVEGLEFVVVPPGLVVDDYAVEIDDVTAQRLGLSAAEDATTLGIVTLGDVPTVNLLGPMVINARTGAAMQVVLHEASYGVRQPIERRHQAGEHPADIDK
jgi:flagellar assembly factor FliW